MDVNGRRKNLRRDRRSSGNTAGSASRRPRNTLPGHARCQDETLQIRPGNTRKAHERISARSGARGRRIVPRKDQSSRQSRLVNPTSALCTKALAGPTDRTARLVREAKPQKPRPNCPSEPSPRSKSRGGQKAKRHVGARRGNTHSHANLSNTAKSIKIKTHERRRISKEARPGRENSP